MILGKPNTKCPHGIFKAGEAVARYCSFCNPQMALAAVHGVSGGVGKEVEPEEEIVDCLTFIERNHAAPLIATR